MDMLGREEEALVVYKKLLSRGQKAIAEDECGEGEEWAASLMADCLYRVGCVLEDLGRTAKAAQHYRNFLHMLDWGVQTIYDREEAAAKLRALIPEKDRRAGLNEVLNAVELKELVSE